MVQKGLTVVPGGHMSIILVFIIGFRQWGVRKDQNMAQKWASRMYIYEFFLALEPSRGPYLGQGSQKKTQINQVIWGPFMVFLTHLGASTGLRSQQFCIGFTARAAFLAIF